MRLSKPRSLPLRTQRAAGFIPAGSDEFVEEDEYVEHPLQSGSRLQYQHGRIPLCAKGRLESQSTDLISAERDDYVGGSPDERKIFEIFVTIEETAEILTDCSDTAGHVVGLPPREAVPGLRNEIVRSLKSL